MGLKPLLEWPLGLGTGADADIPSHVGPGREQLHLSTPGRTWPSSSTGDKPDPYCRLLCLGSAEPGSRGCGEGKAAPASSQAARRSPSLLVPNRGSLPLPLHQAELSTFPAALRASLPSPQPDLVRGSWGSEELDPALLPQQGHLTLTSQAGEAGALHDQQSSAGAGRERGRPHGQRKGEKGSRRLGGATGKMPRSITTGSGQPQSSSSSGSARAWPKPPASPGEAQTRRKPTQSSQGKSAGGPQETSTRRPRRASALGLLGILRVPPLQVAQVEGFERCEEGGSAVGAAGLSSASARSCPRPGPTPAPAALGAPHRNVLRPCSRKGPGSTAQVSPP